MNRSKKQYITLLMATILVLAVACHGGNSGSSRDYRPDRNDMADMNRYMIRKDRERIQSYSERKALTVQETSTGLWYGISEEGTGDFLTDGDMIRYEYNCSLLDGTECYSSQEFGPAEVQIGRSELPAGLYEGLKLLKRGSTATFIIPPFLAYGLVGDGKKIPPRATLVYSVLVIK